MKAINPKSLIAISVLLLVMACMTWLYAPTGNVARAGSSGVVLEDLNKIAEETFLGISSPHPPCWCCPTYCHCDFNCDGVVNTTDFFALKNSWFQCAPAPQYNQCADFNMDGCVNTTDFFECKDHWFQTVPADCPIDPICPQ